MWLGTESLAVEFAGDTLARYDVEYSAETNRLREVKRARLFETTHQRSLAQLRLFELDVLGEAGWLKGPEVGGVRALQIRAAASPAADTLRLRHGGHLAADMTADPPLVVQIYVTSLWRGLSRKG